MALSSSKHSPLQLKHANKIIELHKCDNHSPWHLTTLPHGRAQYAAHDVVLSPMACGKLLLLLGLSCATHFFTEPMLAHGNTYVRGDAS